MVYGVKLNCLEQFERRIITFLERPEALRNTELIRSWPSSAWFHKLWESGEINGTIQDLEDPYIYTGKQNQRKQ